MVDVGSDDVSFFIGEYPDPSDENFTREIARKKEFYDIRLTRSEPVPDQPGTLLLSQIFMKRFFSPHTPYQNALLYHGIGTGKTCVASAIIENFKNTIVDGRPRKPAIVLVKSEELARNVVNEIAYICTKDEYFAKPTAAEIKRGIRMTQESRTIKINRAIAKTYEIHAVETFLQNMPSMEVLRKTYSNRLIIVDESHIFRIQPAKTKKGKKSINVGLDEEIEEEQEKEVLGTLKKNNVLYDNLYTFLHSLDDCRSLLLTGTPIWDKSSEIASQLNLILPEDEKLPTGKDFDDYFFDEDGNLKEDTLEILKEKMKGRVSFLRAMITNARKTEMGLKAPYLKYVKIYPDAMSETQAAYARKARESMETKTIKMAGKNVTREIKGGTVLKTARDAMNMVLPVFDSAGKVVDVVYGPEAFKQYIVEEKKRRKGAAKGAKGGVGEFVNITTYSIKSERLRTELKNNLAEYATKFASIIEDIKAHPDEVTFIYDEEVTGLGGAIMLGLCMQLHGFSWVKTASDIKEKSGTKRFAVITSNPQTTSQPKQIHELIQSCNKSDNKYGERLQVIIGSEKIALGLSIKNVRRVHIVMPHWNIPFTDQAEGRGLRFGSHDALLPEERVITIFRHAAVEKGEGDENLDTLGAGYPRDTTFSSIETTDIYIYKIAEEKEHRNTQIYRVMKEAAFDCAIFYERNVLPEDVPGTRECDYQDCNYECDAYPKELIDKSNRKTGVWKYSIPEEDLDYSTYSLFYASDRIKEIIAEITELFHGHFSLSIGEIQQLLNISPQEKPLLLHSLDIIIDTRILIRNRYGFRSYLKEHGNIVFLDNNIYYASSYPEITYIENPLVTEFTSMDSLLDIIELESDKISVTRFCKNPNTDIWNSLSYKTKIILLEAVYSRSLEDKELDLASSIVLDELGDYIYIMADSTPVHILYSEEFKGLAYDVAAKDVKATGNMRAYDSTFSSWKYVTSREKEEEYVDEIKTQVTSSKEDAFADNHYGAFGWISKKDGSFRINLKQEPGKKGKIRGRKCINFQVPDLVDIYIERLRYLPEPKEDYLEFNKETLIKAIKGRIGFSKHKDALEKKSADYLRRLLTLMTMHINELCEGLRQFFEDNDLLYSM